MDEPNDPERPHRPRAGPASDPPATPPPAAPESASPAAPPTSSWAQPKPRDDGTSKWSIFFGLVLVAIGLWFFADYTLGLDMPTIRWSQLWPLILIGIGGLVVLGARGTGAERAVHGNPVRARRRVRGRPALARGLAPADRHALRRGPGDVHDGSRDRARPLAGRARAALPRPPAVAGADRRTGPRSGRATSTTTPHCGSRSRSSTRRSPGAAARCALELPNSGADTLSFSRLGTVELPFPEACDRCRSSGWRATRAASSSRSGTPPTGPRRTAPAATWSMPPRAPISAATPPPARSSWTSTSPSSRRARSIPLGLSAGPAREPARPPDPRG